jgi:hypothetical protein
MTQFLRRLKYLFLAPAELDALIAKEKKLQQEAEYEDNRYILNLCHKHRQEPNHSDYRESNCHYCQLQKHSTWQQEQIMGKDQLILKLYRECV